MVRQALLLCFFLGPAAGAFGAVVAYEATLSFPEQADPPWERDAYCEPERWLAEGRYFQRVGLCDGVPPPGGQRESYRHSLADFAGEPTFFIEWCVMTDGPSSEIAGVAPCLLSAWGHAGVLYHFTTSADEVRFLRDPDFPPVYIDIAPGVLHTYRLELYGDELYIWYIDRQAVDSGLPEGPYPMTDSRITWSARSWYLEHTTERDFVRYGTIPLDGSGDYDTDEFVDVFDFYFFRECLSNSSPDLDAGPGCRFADFDFDTDVNLSDFAAFQNAFTGSQ